MADVAVERSGRPRLLVVDDETRLRETFMRALAGRGYDVTGAVSFSDAMRALRAEPFDLLLVDINLPDATGWDILRIIRAGDRSVPVIVLSAVPPQTTLVRELRPDGVLHKPFPIDALFRLVERTLNGEGQADRPASDPGDGYGGQDQ